MLRKKILKKSLQPKKKRNNEEELIHRAFVKWLSFHPILKEYYLHVPNGGSRNVIEARNLKLLGVRKGVSDIFIPYASNGYSGLWIEIKTMKGKISEEQEMWLTRMKNQGYDVAVCRTVDICIETVKHYMQQH